MAKLFCLNGDALAEYVFAGSKKAALTFAAECWGIETVLEYFKEWLADNPGGNEQEFIEYFAQEVDSNSEFMLKDEYGRAFTKKVYTWINQAKEIPSHFACEDY